jgi:glycosyltransferase involved in cell wall biosynthesis
MQKGPDYFLQAAKRVLEYRKNVVFVVSGSGDMAQEMIDRAAFYGIGDKVLFVGWTKGNDISKLYRMADLFVMPSVSEPYGLVPLESLLNNTPVLISRQSGVSEVLQHALKTDFWDIDDMSNKIIAVLDNPALQETLASEGGKEARAQVWSKVAQRCMMIYERFVKSFAHI